MAYNSTYIPLEPPGGVDYLVWLELVSQQEEALCGFEEWLLGWTQTEEWYVEEAEKALGV